MKNKYTTGLTALAALALFASGALAQVNINGLGTVNADTGVGDLVVGEESSMTTTTGADNNVVDGIPVPGAPPNTVFNVTRSYSRLDEIDTTGATTVDNDGNVTLTAGLETDQGASTADGIGTDVFLAARYEVYPDGHPSEGLPVPGTEEYVLVEEDPNTPGTYIEVTVGGEPYADANALEAALNALTATDFENLGLLSWDTVDQGTNGGNLQVGGDANVDGVLSVGAVADVEMALGDNTSDIAVNASDIAVNVSDIADNDSDIAVNVAAIASNDSDIAVNVAEIASNDSDIAVNVAAIASNDSDIAVNVAAIASNDSDIAVNAADIDTNEAAIAVNAADIDTNEADIASNSASISANAADIADNASTLVVHEGLVTQNIADIATNAADIADNASTLVVHEGLVTQNIADIADNAAAIGNNWNAIDNIQTNGIAGIIEKKSDGIHIGEDSLVTNLNEETGNQDLWALNDGELTDINILSDVNVTSKLTVQAEAQDSVTEITPATEIKPPYLNEDGVLADTVAVYTETGSVAVTTSNFDQSGVVATANGDLSLYASGGTQDVTNYVTAVRADIWDETQGDNAGFLAAPEVEVGGYIDDNGDFIELGELNEDGVLDLTMLDSATLAMITVAGEELPGGGGNLLVEGDARIDGALKLGSIENVEQSILDEVAARAAADETLSAAINAEEVARATADDVLQGNIDQVASNLSDEAAARAAADATIVAGYMAADQAIVNGYMQADSLLAARISSVEDKVESNTRGIAMVAALTSPTVREGMENALDFSLAHFDGETGAAISYARRVNENVQLNIAAASTTDFDESVVRGGVSLQW